MQFHCLSLSNESFSISLTALQALSTDLEPPSPPIEQGLSVLLLSWLDSPLQLSVHGSTWDDRLAYVVMRYCYRRQQADLIVSFKSKFRYQTEVVFLMNIRQQLPLLSYTSLC